MLAVFVQLSESSHVYILLYNLNHKHCISFTFYLNKPTQTEIIKSTGGYSTPAMAHYSGCKTIAACMRYRKTSLDAVWDPFFAINKNMPHLSCVRAVFYIYIIVTIACYNNCVLLYACPSKHESETKTSAKAQITCSVRCDTKITPVCNRRQTSPSALALFAG